MTRDRNALKAGVFIVISIGLIFAIAVGIKGSSGMFEAKVVRIATFALKDDVGGLRVGDDVRIGGYKVGLVRSIELGTRERLGPATQPAIEPAIIVRFTMPRRYMLRQDAIVSIQGTVTGQSWLNFESLGESGPPLPPDTPLRGLPGTMTVALGTLREAAPKLNQSLGHVQEILAEVKTQTVPLVNDTLSRYRKMAETGTSLLEEVKGHVGPAMEKYHAVADSGKGMMDEIRSVFGDTKLDFRQTMKNVRSATDTMNAKLPGLLERIGSVLEKGEAAMADAGAALKDIRTTVATVKTVVAGNKNKLDSMIEHLNATALNLELGAGEIRARPWRLLYTPKKQEMENLVLFDAAREFASAAKELNNAAQAMRDAVGAQAEAEKIGQISQHLEETFEHFTEVERKLWDALRP